MGDEEYPVEAEEALPPPEASLDADDPMAEEEPLPRLSLRQRVIVFGAFLAAFLLSFFLFLPYSDIVRPLLARGLGGQARLEYANLDLNLFRDDEVESPRVSLHSGLTLRADRISSSLGWMALFARTADGGLRALQLQLQNGSLDLSIVSLKLRADGLEFGRGLGNLRGRLRIEASGIRILQAPGLAGDFLGGDRGIFDSLQAELTASGNNLRFNSPLELSGNRFRIRIDGQIQLGGSAASSTLNLNVCIKPAADLERIDPDLFQIYIFQGGAAGGQLCKEITGPLANPQVKGGGDETTNSNPSIPAAPIVPGASPPEGSTPAAAPPEGRSQ
ncbi:MAG: hypothetical protein K1X75_04970 [Leptospirales bacterium]|nr:hypothetical protein [Leptospirales bacterium]